MRSVAALHLVVIDFYVVGFYVVPVPLKSTV